MRRLATILILIAATMAATSCRKVHITLSNPKEILLEEEEEYIEGEYFIEDHMEKEGASYVNDTEVSRVVLNLASKLNYEKHLVLEDSTVFFDEKINRIRLDFTSMDTIGIWEARGLIVDLVEEFVGRINSNSQIYPFLGKTPFSASDLEVYITFVSFYNRHVDLQKVGLITLRHGLTHYIMTDGIDCDTPCWHQRTETYIQSRNFIRFHREGEALYKPRPVKKEKYFGEERLYE